MILRLFQTLLIGWLMIIRLTWAVEDLQALSSDHRIKTVVYDPNNVVTLQGTPLVNSQIILGDGESVTDIQCGDLAAWSVTVSKSTPNVVNVKPNVSVSNTDMVITTINQDQQVKRYILHLIAKKMTDLNASTFSIRYVEAKQLPVFNHVHSQGNVSALLDHSHHWDYWFNGCRDIVPIHVFDDGSSTYFMLQHHAPIPAFFAVMDKQGHETLLNMRHEGNYWVAHQIAPQFTLRSSQECVATIFNHHLIEQLEKKD